MAVTLDSLTGLLNRSAFTPQLEAALRSGQPLVLAVMDLDKFHGYNTANGHQAGDAWIRAVGGLFASAFASEGGFAARYGGDEFLAAVPAQDLFAVYQRAEALRQQIESDPPAVAVEGKPVQGSTTISIGLAAYPANAAGADELLEKGETTLRRAKAAGGNTVAFFQETDTLTGLLDLYASQRALEKILDQARARGEPVSLFLIDIDSFKEINDEHGHRAGDEVLKRLAHMLEANFQDAASIARISGEDQSAHIGRTAGDEFLVILPGQRADSAFILAEEVRRLVEDSQIQLSVGGRAYALRFHISGGIATFPTDGAEAVDLLRKAGEALYRSKQTGRNRISLPTSAQMITKTSYYTQVQLERLSAHARRLDKTEAFLLREALDDLLRKYDEN